MMDKGEKKIHIVLCGIAFLLACFIQITLLNLIAIKGITPNLLLALVIIVAYLSDYNMCALVYGAIFGGLLDIISAPVFGAEALGLFFVGLGIVFVNDFLSNVDIYKLSIIAVASIAAHNIFTFYFLKLVGIPLNFADKSFEMLLSGVYTFGIVVLLYFIAMIYLLIIDRIKRRKRRSYYRK